MRNEQYISDQKVLYKQGEGEKKCRGEAGLAALAARLTAGRPMGKGPAR